ncbi:MAG: asparaginase [Rhodospirillaceae bacterium]|nr:asparaginase [Rhodospirillaceae bacterium]
MERNHTIIIEVTRGDMVESRHRCHAAIVDSTGKVLDSWGDVDQYIYPRSSIKPLQALPLIETGAADALGVSDPEIALACASHMSEPHHVDTVRAWLDRIGLGPGNLECGGHLPRHEDAAADVIRAGIAPDAAFNNCSGKHSGFLTTAVHLGEATQGYIDDDHPVQARLAAILSDLGGVDLSGSARGHDGCGIPVIGMPLVAMARALARMADPEGLGGPRARAAETIFRCMTTHPEYVRGTGGFDTAAMRAGSGRFATKTGAEGIHAAIVPELNIGIALKIEDGGGRASDVAVGALLGRLGVIDDVGRAALRDFLEVPISNATGRNVGSIRIADGWAE